MFDLSLVKPSDFVQHGLSCLERVADLGDDCARATREKLRIMVTGKWVISFTYFNKLVGLIRRLQVGTELLDGSLEVCRSCMIRVGSQFHRLESSRSEQATIFLEASAG